ncbi:serine/threonine protein kinase, partial [Candidatus Parcubacteria bacterium]
MRQGGIMENHPIPIAGLTPAENSALQRRGYTPVRLLGEGGMGVVILARHDALGEDRAVKILRHAGRGAKQRALREARIMSRLRQVPGIVPVYDAWLDEATEVPYIAMEYMAGGTLAQHCADLTFTGAVKLVADLLDTLERVHEKRLIHRDIKPENVMFRPDDPRPYLGDFGIVATPEPAEGGGRTRIGVPMGTPAFMAPEQARSAAEVD